MDNIIELQRVPLLNGLVHHFDCEGENTIRRVDFNTLRMRPQERILHASEVKLSDLEGLPELTSSESYSTEVKDDGSYGTLMIFPKSCQGVCDTAWKKQDDERLPLMAFDPVSKSLFQDSNSAWCDIKYNPYYKKTEIGHVIHNGIHGGRGMPSWASPSLLNPETGKLTGIAFANGNYSEFEIQPEYRILDSLAGWESLGSSLCVWAPVPGDETKSYWLAGGENVCALILIDETTKTGRVVQSWNGVWGRSCLAKNVSNPVWLPDKQWLCLPTQENCWAVIEIKDFTQSREEKYSICTGAGGAWALILPDGRYAGSPGCEKLLLGATGENTWAPMVMLAPWRNRPAEVLEADARGELLEAMLKAGMSVEGTGDTPLLFEYRSLDVLKVLLANGVDPNLRNKSGKTRLQELADSIIDLSADDLEQILVLLQHGASTEGIGEQSKRYSDFCDVQKLHQALSAAAPAPELPEGKAPATLGDSVLLLTYEGAESSTRSYEEEDAEPTPFEPYANSAPQTILAMPDHEQGTVRHYRRTGADTAETKVYSVFPGCQFGKLVARYADRLTADQVCECVSPYMGDGANELQLTFDSPTTATAQELQGASCEETIIRNVKVTLQPADFRLPEAH